MNLYTESIKELKKTNKVRFFLRFDPLVTPNEYDDNYIANQIDACNYFFCWFSNPNCSFMDMLRQQHRLAALGKTGNNTYLIKGYFRTREGGCDNWDLRDNLAGKTRYELRQEGIDHAHLDLLRIRPNEYDIYRDEDYFKKIYQPATGKIGVDSATMCTANIAVDDQKVYSHSFMFRKNRYFYIKHPEGSDFEYLQSELIKKMSILLSLKKADKIDLDNLLLHLASYYQLFLVWMPFAHINNSIVWGQMNAILQYFGYGACTHGRLDTYAMLLSSKNFWRLFEFHVKDNN